MCVRVRPCASVCISLSLSLSLCLPDCHPLLVSVFFLAPKAPACSPGGCLFDLEEDPYERSDISEFQPGIKAQLQALLQVSLSHHAAHSTSTLDMRYHALALLEAPPPSFLSSVRLTQCHDSECCKHAHAHTCSRTTTLHTPSLPLQNASATYFQTGDDNYKGNFTNCADFQYIRFIQGQFAAPVCYKPNL